MPGFPKVRSATCGARLPRRVGGKTTVIMYGKTNNNTDPATTIEIVGQGPDGTNYVWQGVRMSDDPVHPPASNKRAIVFELTCTTGKAAVASVPTSAGAGDLIAIDITVTNGSQSSQPLDDIAILEA